MRRFKRNAHDGERGCCEDTGWSQNDVLQAKHPNMELQGGSNYGDWVL